ncbi:MAG: hypothetical protein GXO89_17875 [Chlorobi bacterium]|nr:hypothetical protein [Chlorobiota bacterium]
MDTLEIKEEKLNLIAWIANIQDVSIIEKLKSVQDKYISIPNWQRKETNKRLSEIDKNPDSAIDFDKMLSALEKKHVL